MVMLETLGMANSSLGIPGGLPALTCLGIQSPGGCHASACSGIHQPRVLGAQHASTCLEIWSLRGCHTSTCSGVCWSQRAGMPWPAQGPSSLEDDLLDLPGDSVSRRLSRFSLSGDLQDLHSDLGTPGSQIATVLGRISFRQTHP